MNKKFIQDLKNLLIAQLKGAAVKAALKMFLGTAAGIGLKAWLVKFLVTEFYDEIAEPIIEAGIVEVGYAYRKHEGKVLIEKLKEAQENGNAEDYDNASDDVMS